MPESEPESKIKRAIESVGALAFARVVVPVLLFAIIGVLRGIVTDIDSLKSDVRDVNTRLDERVLRQVDSNTGSIADHEKRIQRLERVTPIP